MDTNNQDTDSEKIPDGFHRHTNPDGSVGGLVSNGARVSKSAYIGRDATIKDGGEVLGNARILDRAIIHGKVQDEAIVCGEANLGSLTIVADHAVISGQARLEDIVIDGYAHVKNIQFYGYKTHLPESQFQGMRISGGEFQGIAAEGSPSPLQLTFDDSGHVNGMSLHNNNTHETEPLPNVDELLQYVEYPVNVRALMAFPSAKGSRQATDTRTR